MAFFQTENMWVNQVADGVADLVLDVPGSKVNALSRAVVVDLDMALDRVAENANFRLLVLRTAKTASFCAGMAPKVLATMTPADFNEIATLGQHVCDKLARLHLPTVAIISGGCLGGGLELALACDYRIAINRPSTIFAFADLDLGLIPMWGGTQRLPKLVGLERGLQMLLGGRRLSSRDARAWGLVDEVTDAATADPPAFLKNPAKRTAPNLPLRTLRQKLTESTRLGRWLILRGAERVLRGRLPDDMLAPWLALEAVRMGQRVGLEAGLARERAAAMELAQTEACRNLVRLHVERDRFRMSPDKKARSDRPRTIGVLGTGSRGVALIYMAATRGWQVLIRAGSEGALGYSLFQMLTIFQKGVARGTMARADLMKNIGNIRGTTAWKGFNEVDLVLVANEEGDEEKKSVFKQLENHTTAGTLLVSTAPDVTVTEVQEGLAHPERVAGLHFLEPVGRSLLVEVVASDKTQPDVARRLTDFVVALGRTPQPVKDMPGFLVQRLLLPYFSEAILLVKEGFQPARVDEAMVRFGMMRGPLEHLDLMGLDVAATLARVLAPVLEPRLVLDGTFAFMAQKKWLGQKTGLGFYRYLGRKQKEHHALSAHLRADFHVAVTHRLETASKADQRAQARRRLLWLMVNEAAWCLEEGRAKTVEALDLAMMLAGWAPHRGGPLHYARHVGIETVIRELEKLAAERGPRYEPCPALRGLAK